MVYSSFPNGAQDSISKLAKKIQTKTKSDWTECTPFGLSVISPPDNNEPREPRFLIETKWGNAPLSMPGHRAAQNTATALTLFNELGYDPTLYLQAIER